MPKCHQVDLEVYRNDSNLIFLGVLNHLHWGRANTDHSQIIAKKIIFPFEQKNLSDLKGFSSSRCHPIST